MSLHYLKIISTESSFVPEKVLQDKAKDFLAKLYTEEELEFTTTSAIEFVDQGENFETVSCNLCGLKMQIEDWQNAMDSAYEKQFTDLQFTTSCCRQSTSLNDLTYHSSAGFAKFVISISNAYEEIPEKHFHDLQEILNTSLRSIWVHY
jgi:transcription elongation factor Elf1